MKTIMNIEIDITDLKASADLLRKIADKLVDTGPSLSQKMAKAKSSTKVVELNSVYDESADESLDETAEEVTMNSGDEDLDLSSSDDTLEDEIETPKKPAKSVTAAKPLTLEKNIIPAFQAFAKKHSREKAGKVLAKYKVKSVRDLPTTKFPEILKLLGA